MSPFLLKSVVRPVLAGGLTLVSLAACVAPQPAYPVRVQAAQPAPPPPPPPPPPPSPQNDGSVRSAPSTRVESAPLPPVGAPRSQSPASSATTQPRPGASLAPAAPRPSAPAAVVPTASSASGSASSPRQTTVRRGETLFEVAEREHTPVRSLIELNNLQPPYDLPAGTVLLVPQPAVYTVKGGDTLFGIARRFSVDPRSLANLNDFPLEAAIRPGQKIALPPMARDGGATPGATGDAPPAAVLAQARPPVGRPVTGALATPAVASPASPALSSPPPVFAADDDAPEPPVSQVAAAGRGRFMWPIRGEVLSGFGPKGPGQRNDGLNIAAAVGEPVKAAAAGEVAYAGDLPGFGNLVLLKHPGGWVTAYAHLSKLEVKMRDRVAQGQELGQAGQTGEVDRPQVHFEVRYAANPREKAKPVDPALLLPG